MVLRLVLIVTGASRGFGRAVCEAFFDAATQGQNDDDAAAFSIVQCCLVARSVQGLGETKASLETKLKHNDKNAECLITTHAVDLGDLDTLDAKLEEILATLTTTRSKFDKMILINNAGSTGEIGSLLLATQSATLADWKQTVDLNVTSMFWVTRKLGQWAQNTSVPAVLVNISSLVAIQPFPSMALYSAGKAARDMYYACLAKELANDKDNNPNTTIRLLNYAPGPLETDMVQEIRAAPGLHDSLKPSYAQKQLNPADSARILVQLLQKDDFESGAHIDYYDVAQPGNAGS